MFDRIFHRNAAEGRSQNRQSGYPAAPASASGEASGQAEGAVRFDITVDDTIRALDAGLSSLGRIPVAQAAKERGWATLQKQLERRPVRPSAPSVAKGAGSRRPAQGGSAQPVLAGHSRGWRIALGSAGAAVAIIAVVLGTYSAGLLGGGDESSPFASVTTTEATAPDTTVPTGDTVPTTDSTSVTPGTEGTSTTGDTTVVPTTEGTTTTGSTPATTTGTTRTTGGSVTTESTPPTTKPAQTTTTNEQQMAAAQRQKDAEAVTLDLADAVIRYFWDDDGDLTGVRSLVASSAYSSLTILVKSLTEPSGYNVVGAKALSGDTVRITLEFADVDENPRFFITVKVDDGGATITAISAGF